MSAMTDDEQLESLKSFTKKYGSSIIIGILVALIAFFGWEYWQKKNLAESQMQTAKVQQLMDEAQAADGDALPSYLKLQTRLSKKRQIQLKRFKPSWSWRNWLMTSRITLPLRKHYKKLKTLKLMIKAWFRSLNCVWLMHN